MRILIVGSNRRRRVLIGAALRSGMAVSTIVWARGRPFLRRRLSQHMEVVRCDPNDLAALRQVSAQADCVVSWPGIGAGDHAAALRLIEQLSESRKNVRRVLHVATLGYYSPVSTPEGQLHATLFEEMEARGLPRITVAPNVLQEDLLDQWNRVLRGLPLLTFNREVRVSYVALHDVVDVMMVALSGQVSVGTTLTVTGPQAISFEHFADTAARAAGVPTLVQQTADLRTHARDLGLSLEMAREVEWLHKLYSGGHGAEVTPDIVHVLGRQAVGIETTVLRHAQTNRLTRR